MSKFLALIDKCDDANKKRILTLRTNQRREYMLSVSNLVGLEFWSERDDLALDDIDAKLAAVIERSMQQPTIEKLQAIMEEPQADIPSFLNKRVDETIPTDTIEPSVLKVRS